MKNMTDLKNEIKNEVIDLFNVVYNSNEHKI